MNYQELVHCQNQLWKWAINFYATWARISDA